MLNYAHPETLVDTQWLAEHLEDSNIRIIEMDSDSKSYDEGHIPGSVFWSAFALLLPNMRTNFDLKAIAKLLSNSGISNDTIIIAAHRSYSASSGLIFWLLKIFGHQDVRILNGGCPKWQQENLPLSSEATVVTPTRYHPQPMDNSLRASSTDVKQAIGQSDRIILDVRTPQEYRGEIYLQQPPQKDERAGHITGAVNLCYELAHNKDTTFKSAPELQQMCDDLGITPDKLIIPYCAVGGRSAHVWFILKYLLGYSQVKNYDGSWNEWSRISDSFISK